jgi:hypothetical protein
MLARATSKTSKAGKQPNGQGWQKRRDRSVGRKHTITRSVWTNGHYGFRQQLSRGEAAEHTSAANELY